MRVARVFPPSVIAMLCRSRDAFLQTVGAQLLSALAAADPNLRLRLLAARSVKPLLSIVHGSRSVSARFEAMHALGCLSQKEDEALTALALERATRSLVHALTSFASGTYIGASTLSSALLRAVRWV